MSARGGTRDGDVHRQFGIALAEGWVDYCCDLTIDQCWQQFSDTGTTWRTELDEAADKACELRSTTYLAELATRHTVYIIENAVWKN